MSAMLILWTVHTEITTVFHSSMRFYIKKVSGRNFDRYKELKTDANGNH